MAQQSDVSRGSRSRVVILLLGSGLIAWVVTATRAELRPTVIILHLSPGLIAPVVPATRPELRPTS